MEVLTKACILMRDDSGLEKVVLGGGVFQNRTLLAGMEDRLLKERFQVFSKSLVPSNDGGIALGQAVAAHYMSKKYKEFRIHEPEFGVKIGLGFRISNQKIDFHDSFLRRRGQNEKDNNKNFSGFWILAPEFYFLDMIASLHPCITKDINILCAGRLLTIQEKKRLTKAQAVVVPQGVTAEVYKECRRLVPRVFPNYDLRFPLEGKLGDALLFDYFQVPHPRTLIFRSRKALLENYPDLEMLPSLLSGYPLVLKANQGGEGAFVFLIHSKEELLEKLDLLPEGARNLEGFVLQELIDHGGKDLRVVVLFDTFYAYWRRQPDPNRFLTNLSNGGVIDYGGDALLKERAIEAVRDFCQRSGINLAGFDILFDQKANPAVPLFLEINYYFGRKGLGGSMRFYELLTQAADRWLASFEQDSTSVPHNNHYKTSPQFFQNLDNK